MLLNFMSVILIDFEPFLYKWDQFSLTIYGILFASGFAISRFVVKYMFLREGRWRIETDMLLVYMILGTTIGARLGHIIFYEPHLLNSVSTALMIWKGGLSSHGTSVGILVAVALYTYHWDSSKTKFIRTKREGYSYLQYIDRMVIVVALGGCFIRVGNFVNAESLGKPASKVFGVIHSWPLERDILSRLGSIDQIDLTLGKDDSLMLLLHFHDRVQDSMIVAGYGQNIIRKRLKILARNEGNNFGASAPIIMKKHQGHFDLSTAIKGIPRYPVQLYEALVYLILFLYLFKVWHQNWSVLPTGKIFGIFLVVLFGSRVFLEFFKEETSKFNFSWLNMSQMLSIPFFLMGIYLLYETSKFSIDHEV